MKKQQCQHYRHHQVNRWQLNRSRWAGSQQCIDSMGCPNYQRPCSTASSCASSLAINYSGVPCTGPTCGEALNGDSSNGSIPHQAALNDSANRRLINQTNAGNRASSPSNLSQISSYSDYIFDQSCCNSRQQSVTPVPSNCNNPIQRPHSMSVSMFDLQKHQQSDCRDGSLATIGAQPHTRETHAHEVLNDLEQARQKDEQLRRVLGAGKSFDGACSELYQMSHWSTTMARVTRLPPSTGKPRSMSIDETQAGNGERKDYNELEGACNRQSSYYRHFHDGDRAGTVQNDGASEQEQNSDDEILQSLVRTATARTNHSTPKSSLGSMKRSGNSSSSQSGKGVRNKFLSRFDCDNRKSCEYH